ncbi:hypothetical protein HRED_05788 [Candidatus Haloredivivus sp. G17]|nr:hypothetical protein HRED_05788 [Candidatus Haloredivivus sp. G17]
MITDGASEMDLQGTEEKSNTVMNPEDGTAPD